MELDSSTPIHVCTKDLHPNGSHSSIIMILKFHVKFQPIQMAAKVIPSVFNFTIVGSISSIGSSSSPFQHIHSLTLSHSLPWRSSTSFNSPYSKPFKWVSRVSYGELVNLQNWGFGQEGYIRVIRKVTLLSPPIHPLFHWYPQSKDILLNLSMKCCNSVWNAETQHLMHLGFETNYSSCTVRSSENICSNSGGVQEKGKTDETQLPPKLMLFWVSSPVECWCTFLKLFFESHPVCGQTQGSGAVFFLLYG
jgi:hypothetical protein